MEDAENVAEESRVDSSSCATCTGSSPEPVYAIGTISVRFPSPAFQREYEFERAALSAGNTEDLNLVAVLEKRPDLARLICWVFSTQNIERFYLRPRSDRELQALLDAIRPVENGEREDTHVIIGWVLGNQNCMGVELPVAIVETSYHFDRRTFLDAMFDALEKDKKGRPAFIGKARETFDAIVGLPANDGTGLNRAVNWAAVRYAPLYELVARANENDEILSSIELRPSAAGNNDRAVADVLFTYGARKFGPASRYRLSVDVSELFPYPVSPSFVPAYDV